jgi:hypothetical protein
VAPVLAFSNAPATTSAGTLTSASFTPTAGDVIVVKVITEDSTLLVYNTPTATGTTLTFTNRVLDATANHTWTGLWTAVVGTGGSATTVSATKASGTAGHAVMMVERWTGAQLAATPATQHVTGSGAPSATITTVAGNSVVSWCDGDWSAVAGTAAYRSSATQDGIDQSGAGTAYCAYSAWQTAATAGSQTFGMTAPTGQSWTLAAVEIQSTNGTSHSGPFNLVLPKPSVSLTGKTTHSGSFNLVLPKPVVSLTGKITHSGSFNVSLPKPAVSLSASKGVAGAFNVSLPKPSVSLNAGKGVAGSFNLVLPKPSVSLAGKSTHSGAFNVSLPKPSVSLSASKGIAGAFNLVLPKPSVSLTGKTTHSGSFNLVLPKSAVSLTGKITHSGSFNVSLPKPAVSLSAGKGVAGNGQSHGMLMSLLG